MKIFRTISLLTMLVVSLISLAIPIATSSAHSYQLVTPAFFNEREQIPLDFSFGTNFGFPSSFPAFGVNGPEYIPAGSYYSIGGYTSPSVVPGRPMKLFIIRSYDRRQGETLEGTITRFLRENRPSHVWGGGWHYLTLAPRERATLVAAVGTLDRPGQPNWDQFRWTSTHISNFDKWTACGHSFENCYELGTDAEQGYRSFSGDLLIKFRNPPNVNGWTGDDIQYRFGK